MNQYQEENIMAAKVNTQGYIWMPYIMNVCVEQVDLLQFSPKLSIYSRYRLVDKRDEKLDKLLYPLLYDSESLGSSSDSSSSSNSSSSISNSIKYIEMSSNTKST